jgi:hypothetical protein
MLHALHDALVKPMPGNPMAPSLAEAWTENPDKRVYEFKLRAGLKFHNGDPFTADNVKFSFERAKGAQLKQKVKEVVDIDPHRVQFVLHEPWPDFMTIYGTLASAAGWITPKSYFEKVGADGFKLIVNTSAIKLSGDFIAFLDRLDAIYRPGQGRPDKPVVLVLDNRPIHISKAARAALAARDWLTIEWLPKYAPELNDIERSWRDLKRHFLAHQTFADIDDLDHAIHKGITDMNHERQSPLCTNLRIAA